MSKFGSFLRATGEKVATALDDAVLGASDDRYDPIRGYLVDENGNIYADDGGNQMVYAQEMPVDTGTFMTATGDFLVDESGNSLIDLQFNVAPTVDGRLGTETGDEVVNHLADPIATYEPVVT